MLQQQWHRNLGIRVNLEVHEFSLHWKMVLEGDYSGVADYAFLMTYFDPNPYLDPFLTPGVGNPTGWTDPVYASMLADANRTLDSQERMGKLANCERHLLRAMPVVPLYFEALTYPSKAVRQGPYQQPVRHSGFQICLDRYELEAAMKAEPITRRTLCAGGMLSVACKTSASAYFGKTDPPTGQRLVYLIGSEPDTLDPGKTTGGYESFIVPALFEGLTNFHPTTAQPMAALATHYEVNADFTQYTFYLRGHPGPRGEACQHGNTATRVPLGHPAPGFLARASGAAGYHTRPAGAMERSLPHTISFIPGGVSSIRNGNASVRLFSLLCPERERR